MEKVYELDGMSSDGCLRNVKRALLQIPEIKKVEVQLYPPSAIITMNKSIALVQLQDKLTKAGHYLIRDVG